MIGSSVYHHGDKRACQDKTRKMLKGQPGKQSGQVLDIFHMKAAACWKRGSSEVMREWLKGNVMSREVEYRSQK